MSSQLRITVVKEFEYRGEQEEWSNTYAFTGPGLTDYEAMKVFCGGLASIESQMYLPTCKAIRALVYQPGSIVADRSIDFAAELGGQVSGSLVVGSNAHEWAGDQAGWIRGKIGVNIKGRPKYVRKYYHAGCSEAGGSTDATIVQWRNAADTVAGQLVGGALPAGRKWCGPAGQLITLTAHSNWTTTRTLKRRGRRPT